MFCSCVNICNKQDPGEGLFAIAEIFEDAIYAIMVVVVTMVMILAPVVVWVAAGEFVVAVMLTVVVVAPAVVAAVESRCLSAAEVAVEMHAVKVVAVLVVAVVVVATVVVVGVVVLTRIESKFIGIVRVVGDTLKSVVLPSATVTLLIDMNIILPVIGYQVLLR